MSQPTAIDLQGLAAELAGRAGRTLVGVTGAPGVGKSTVAADLHSRLGDTSVVVPMDGFHLAGAVLRELGLAAIKGAPETFDAAGFVAMLERLRHQPPGSTVYAPAFDRTLEEPIAGSIAVTPEHHTVIVEGNYLLLDGPWDRVASLLDLVVYVDADDDDRRRRLIDRHITFGKAPEIAEEWVRRSDDANAALIASTRARADHVLAV